MWKEIGKAPLGALYQETDMQIQTGCPGWAR